MNIQPYLSFEGRAEEAIEFYKSTLGATVGMIMRFRDGPPEMQAQMSPEAKNKVMHAAFRVGDTELFATDGQCAGKTSFSGISLALNASSNGEAEKMFAALGQGGTVGVPMGETFFAHRFGIVTDKFGVAWMVMNPKP